MQNRPLLERALGDVLRVAASVTNTLGRSYAARHDLHPTDFHALMAVYEADQAGTPLSARGLASALEVTPSAATYVVDRLVESGHVTREAAAHDRRRVDLHYSEHGFDVARSFFVPLGEAYTDALADFSDADLQTALAVMSRLLEATNAYGDGLSQPGEGTTR